jgi:RsiW-degrading membrane proteinase PrsW (M82 family)
MIGSNREPLSPTRAAQANAGGTHSVTVQDPAYKQHMGTTGMKPGIHPGSNGPRVFWARDVDADKLDYFSIVSLTAIAVAWIVLLGTLTYVGILFVIGHLFSLALLTFFYFVGSTRYSCRVNDLVRAYLMGLLFCVPVCIVEGLCEIEWWNAAGQGYIHHYGTPLSRGWAVGAGFFIAFLVYGFFENTLKYLAIRPHMYRDIYYYPMGLSLLGMAVGLGFATTECIFYQLMYGFEGAICRGVIRVPFMGVMGAIIGSLMARHRWIEDQPGAQGGAGTGHAVSGGYTYNKKSSDAGAKYAAAIMTTFWLTGFFDLPFVVILMLQGLFTYWSFWFLGSLLMLIIAFVVWGSLSRQLMSLGPIPATMNPAARNQQGAMHQGGTDPAARGYQA